MNKEDFASLMRGLAQAQAYLAGDQGDSITHSPAQIRDRRDAKSRAAKSAGAARSSGPCPINSK